jgi:sortase (surface protein transpeptidase)
VLVAAVATAAVAVAAAVTGTAVTGTAVTGTALTGTALPSVGAPAGSPVVSPAGAAPSARPWSAAGGVAPAADARPSRVRITAAGVDAPVVPLGIAEDGTLEVPGTATDVGWLTAGAVPGRIGPAVLAGHVDGVSGPGVFARLAELRPGDEVAVDLDDGTTTLFRVVSLERVGKDEFPTEAVYGPSPTPRLRLLTCGGEFDRGVLSYRDNVIVTAEPVGLR